MGGVCLHPPPPRPRDTPLWGGGVRREGGMQAHTSSQLGSGRLGCGEMVGMWSSCGFENSPLPNALQRLQGFLHRHAMKVTVLSLAVVSGANWIIHWAQKGGCSGNKSLQTPHHHNHWGRLGKAKPMGRADWRPKIWGRGHTQPCCAEKGAEENF